MKRSTKAKVLRTMRALSPAKRQKLALCAAVLLVLLGSGMVALNTSLHNKQLAAEQTRQNKLAQAKQQAAQEEEAQRKQKELDKKAQTEQAKPSETSTTPAPAPIKYSTSSDPRSTAYSLTPPKPNPSSFSITVTHAGQLQTGDKVYYNATKGETGYYNGDLIMSPAVVTVSRSGLRRVPITISSPTSRLISMASAPWYERNPYFGIVWDSATPTAPALSHDMFVDTFNMPAAGTYTLHVTAGCTWDNGEGCQSDGFITVQVVD